MGLDTRIQVAWASTAQLWLCRISTEGPVTNKGSNLPSHLSVVLLIRMSGELLHRVLRGLDRRHTHPKRISNYCEGLLASGIIRAHSMKDVKSLISVSPLPFLVTALMHATSCLCRVDLRCCYVHLPSRSSMLLRRMRPQ